jgi:hypothetical protein
MSIGYKAFDTFNAVNLLKEPEMACKIKYLVFNKKYDEIYLMCEEEIANYE